MSFWWPLGKTTQRIDHRIEDTFGVDIKDKLKVHTVSLPAYRYVDLFNAIEKFTSEFENTEKIETAQGELLNGLIHAQAQMHIDRTIKPSTKEAWAISSEQEIFLPEDCFWLCPSQKPEECFIIRLNYNDYLQKSRLELASSDSVSGEKALEKITQLSIKDSIYRGRILHLRYETAKKDDYGDVEKTEHLQVTFSPVKTVSEEDIILSDEHLALIRRNVIDIQLKRDLLQANGVQARRGVLFHGPPGTGKTYACRYICNEVKDTTCLFATGAALANVGAIYSLARLLQPSILFVEDADLMFTSREHNMYSTTLGELMDQMDGLRPQENVSIILTTNDIDRLESALKDRPGRISQCIYMGAPDSELRRRYILQQLKSYDAENLNIARLIEQSEGATQAFIKEWVYRAVQMACERLHNNDDKVSLKNSDFSEALTEMQRFLDATSGNIIGFVERKFSL